jgi:hypothetical protein
MILSNQDLMSYIISQISWNLRLIQNWHTNFFLTIWGEELWLITITGSQSESACSRWKTLKAQRSPMSKKGDKWLFWSARNVGNIGESWDIFSTYMSWGRKGIDGWRHMFGMRKDSRWKACHGMGELGFRWTVMIRVWGAYISCAKGKEVVSWIKAITHIFGLKKVNFKKLRHRNLSNSVFLTPGRTSWRNSKSLRKINHS